MGIQEELFKSIEILVQKYLAKQQVSRTVASTVEGKKDDKYQCKIDGGEYYIKNGLGTNLSRGTAVWVHIPNGRIGSAFIMGLR